MAEKLIIRGRLNPLIRYIDEDSDIPTYYHLNSRSSFYLGFPIFVLVHLKHAT